MKIADKLWVVTGTDRNDPAYAAAAEGLDTKAFEAKVHTGCKWACKPKSVDSGFFVDNTPTSGFKIEKVVSRYSTSNKLFHITDPRGFTLEVPAANLIEILEWSTNSGLTITSDCVWGKESGGTNYLIPVASPLFVPAAANGNNKREFLKASTLVPGDLVVLSYFGKDDTYRFLGKSEDLLLESTEYDISTSPDYRYVYWEKANPIGKHTTPIEAGWYLFIRNGYITKIAKPKAISTSRDEHSDVKETATESIWGFGCAGPSPKTITTNFGHPRYIYPYTYKIVRK